MSDGSRSLPVRPSLRFLKLEAKRRLAAGEFVTLHAGQAAIAREHGLPGWAGLKQACATPPEPQSHALDQLRWMASRFSGADAPGWTAPDEAELRQHFDDRFLAVIPADALVERASKMAADLREELVVISQRPLETQVQLGGLRYIAAADAAPPHRLIGLRGFPVGDRITDPRVKAPGRPVPSVSPLPRSPATSPRGSRAWPPTPAPSWACPRWCWPEASPAARRGWWPPATPTSTGPSPWSPATVSPRPA